jgi:hypothetical protein
MRYRRIGRGDVQVSELGFGCGDTAGIMIRAEPAEQRRAIARAVELGVTYFDTGPSYGKGLSETNLDRVLRSSASAHSSGPKWTSGRINWRISRRPSSATPMQVWRASAWTTLKAIEQCPSGR